jgi:zinc protease
MEIVMNWKTFCTLTLLTGLLMGQASGQAGQKETPPEGGKPRAFILPKKETFALPNGLQVTMIPYGSIPKVAVFAIVNSGNLNESAAQTWLADLTGDLMKEGTATRSAEQISQESARMGGDLNISVGVEQTTVAADVLSEFGPEMVNLIADVMQHPNLPAAEMDRLKNDYIRRITIAKSQSGQLAFERFRSVLYPNHSFGRIYPTEQMVNGYKIEDVQKFYKDNFGAARTHIYIAGRFDSAAMKKAITDAFGGWARGPASVEDIPKPVSRRAIHLIDRPGAAQSTLYIGLPVIAPGNDDYLSMVITNALLGGSFASRITSNIREQKGYTYSPNSQISSRFRDAYWVEIADVTTAVTGPSLKEIFYEIDRLQKDAPSDAELQGIKNYLAGLFVIRNSSRQGLIGQVAFMDLHRLSDTYLTNYVQNVFAVTPKDVQRVAQKYLLSDQMTIVVVGDKSRIADQLTPYGSLANQ